MKTPKAITFYCLLVLCSLTLLGCGKKAAEDNSISEVKAEADRMSIEELKAMAVKYQKEIIAQNSKIEKFADNFFSGIQASGKVGSEAKEMTDEIEALHNSISALTERFQIYYQKLKEKGGDLTGLELLEPVLPSS